MRWSKDVLLLKGCDQKPVASVLLWGFREELAILAVLGFLDFGRGLVRQAWSAAGNSACQAYRMQCMTCRHIQSLNECFGTD